MILNLNSKSVESTKKIGKKIGSILKGNELILLSGDLGMGKTLLTKGIANGLCIPESEVVSPTFTLQNRYFSNIINGYLYHFDLYRLGDSSPNEEKLISPEIDEYLCENIIVVEWAQYLDKSYFEIDNIIKIEIKASNKNPNERFLYLESDIPNFKSILTD